MRWLVRLVTPPDGLVIDPFAGSGTTGEAAYLEGFSSILIEHDPESVRDIERRLNWRQRFSLSTSQPGDPLRESRVGRLEQRGPGETPESYGTRKRCVKDGTRFRCDRPGS